METLTQKSTQFEIINKGWNSLIKGLGPVAAIRFLISFISGKGDSVKHYKNMWQGKSIEEIHKEILKAKQQGEI